MVTSWIHRLLPRHRVSTALREAPPEEIETLLNGGSPPLLLDIRGAETYAAGHLPGALNTPVERLQDSVADFDRGAPVVVY
ncbi:MAG: rhodanese-like domain-containing protein [Armatimonadota bacterium]